ncbi:FixH family protein [Pelistega ratti]|uniref:FixH family protein n=1 Tax=Pelistega ratti TaxID=2652177 RepID=UPI001357B601|nr:FixH family protein [Pelistega ratti]
MKEERDLDKYPNPWYKEPWPWILMAGPFMAIIGCLITIYLAFTNNYDAEVTVKGYQQGKFVSRDGSDIPNLFNKPIETTETKETQK